jgi:SAM-dependent methyltransferase
VAGAVPWFELLRTRISANCAIGLRRRLIDFAQGSKMRLQEQLAGDMRSKIDHGRRIDWGSTSYDYALFRPGPPQEFYDRLHALGIGLPGQRILDLGTGTGVLAREFARRGALACGIDVARRQIEEARRLSAPLRLDIDFRVAPVEEPPFADHSFDSATANQCFLYFNKARTIAALRRVLVPGGRLIISHYNWLPGLDAIAAASEALVLRHNPHWDAAGFDGIVPPLPPWTPSDIRLDDFFWFDVDVPFDHETWRGRIRACRGIGASLKPREVAAFDREHARLLAQIAPATFTIRHRVDARILRFP